MNDFARYPSLEGRVVFITGGGSGIGASMVEHFCAQGSSIAFVDIKQEESLALAARIEGAGGHKPLFIPCDLLDIEALRLAVAQTADELGPIRVLVNNAAEDTRHDVEEVTVEYWDGRMAVNLRHQFFAAQAVAGQMKAAAGGSIINFGSISWMMGQGGVAEGVTDRCRRECQPGSPQQRLGHVDEAIGDQDQGGSVNHK